MHHVTHVMRNRVLVPQYYVDDVSSNYRELSFELKKIDTVFDCRTTNHERTNSVI